MANITEKVKEWREIILLLVTILEIITIVIASYVTSRLAPLSENITVIQTEVRAINDELSDNTNEHADFVTHDEILNSIVPRLDRIEKNQDNLLQLIGRLK